MDFHLQVWTASNKKTLFQKGEDISIVKNRKKGDLRVCKKSIEKRLYLTIKITIDITSVLCAKEEWKEDNSARLLIFE